MKHLSGFKRFAVLFSLDAVIVAVSYFLAFYLRLDGVMDMFSGRYFDNLLFSLPFIALTYEVIFLLFRVNRTMWHFSSMRDYMLLTGSVVLSGCVSFLVTEGYALFKYRGSYHHWLPFKVYILATILALCLLVVVRLLRRYIYRRQKSGKTESKVNGRCMIIGAGSAAALLLENISTSRYLQGIDVVAIVDDATEKRGMSLHGVKILGTHSDIPELAKRLNVDLIIFAIPSASADYKAMVLKICQSTGCTLKVISPLYQLQDGKVSDNDIHDVQLEDLLGREPIRVDVDRIADYVTDQVVLVTGGGGSIGSELCRQIASHQPKELVIFDIYENNAYEIQNELLHNYPTLNLTVLIGSVRDSKRLNQVFAAHCPDVVFHAAAHKHVPLMEDSPNEAIKNNVIGTLKTATAADAFGVKRFVLISTDKAVNPTNVMGASKRMCEMVVQAFNKRSKTDFVAVRFGNVLGSNGSVIPLFKKQIAAGGPVTVTDPDIIRFFMTIPEAVSLVLQAGASAKGGEIFVLDMGKPVRILDMAENLIRLSGYEPYVDMDIQFIGLRPGEKKYEELLLAEEGLQSTENDLIHIGKPIVFDEQLFWKRIEALQACMYDDSVDIRHKIKEIVPTYRIPGEENEP